MERHRPPFCYFRAKERKQSATQPGEGISTTSTTEDPAQQ